MTGVQTCALPISEVFEFRGGVGRGDSHREKQALDRPAALRAGFKARLGDPLFAGESGTAEGASGGALTHSVFVDRHTSHP